MDFEENTVDTQEEFDSAADDAQFELDEEEEDTSESLEDAIAEENGEGEQQQEQPEEQGTSEPGWIKRRISKEVDKAIAATEQRMKAQYDAQLAPILERMLEQDAQDLVRQGEFKSLERAKEYLRLKQGMEPYADEPQRPARDEQGRFASQGDVEINARAQMMAEQAIKVQQSRGLDVMDAYYNDEDVRQMIISGEWDFYDVADYLQEQKASRPKAPAPMRSPNGVSGGKLNAIDTMSDEQFDRLEKRIKEGARYTLK